MWVGPEDNKVVMYGSLLNQISTLLSSTLQWYLITAVSVEVALGFIPYPGMLLITKVSWMKGLIMDFLLDMGPNSSKDTHFPPYGKRPPNQPVCLIRLYEPIP